MSVSTPLPIRLSRLLGVLGHAELLLTAWPCAEPMKFPVVEKLARHITVWADSVGLEFGVGDEDVCDHPSFYTLYLTEVRRLRRYVRRLLDTLAPADAGRPASGPGSEFIRYHLNNQPALVRRGDVAGVRPRQALNVANNQYICTGSALKVDGLANEIFADEPPEHFANAVLGESPSGHTVQDMAIALKDVHDMAVRAIAELDKLHGETPAVARAKNLLHGIRQASDPFLPPGPSADEGEELKEYDRRLRGVRTDLEKALAVVECVEPVGQMPRALTPAEHLLSLVAVIRGECETGLRLINTSEGALVRGRLDDLKRVLQGIRDRCSAALPG